MTSGAEHHSFVLAGPVAKPLAKAEDPASGQSLIRRIYGGGSPSPSDLRCRPFKIKIAARTEHGERDVCALIERKGFLDDMESRRISHSLGRRAQTGDPLGGLDHRMTSPAPGCRTAPSPSTCAPPPFRANNILPPGDGQNRGAILTMTEAITVATTAILHLAEVATRLEHDLLGEREIPARPTAVPPAAS